MPITYLGQYDDNQKILNQLTEIRHNILVIGGSVDNLGADSNCATADQVANVGTKVDAIAQQLPNLARGSDVAQLIGGVRSDVNNGNNKTDGIAQQIPNLARGSDVAQLIGGVRSDVGNVGNKTDAIAQQIPNLARGSDVAQLIGGVRSDVGNVGNKVDSTNASAANAGAQAANAARQAAAANAGIGLIPTTNHVPQLDRIEAAISNLGVGGSSSITRRDYNLSSPMDDLIQLLGSAGFTQGFTDPSPSKIAITASSTFAGSLSSLLNRSTTSNLWLSNNTPNSSVTVDFGVSPSNRLIILTGLGLRCPTSPSSGFPVNVTISGSNNGTNFVNIFAWSAIGLSPAATVRGIAFPNSLSYRFIRVTQSGTTTSGGNQLGLTQIYYYGSVSTL